MALVKCKYCGKDVSDKAKNCPHCGESLVETVLDSEETVTPPTICEECNTMIPQGAEVCPNCGCPVTEKAAKEVAQKVEVTAVNLQAKKSTKKHVIIALAIVAVLAITGVIGYSIHKENLAKEAAQISADYAANMELISYTMLMGAIEAEDAGNLIKQVWYNAIFEERDPATDKYTRPSGYWVDDFNEAIDNLFSDKTFTSQIADIEEMLSYNNLEAADLDMINAKVHQNLNNLIICGGNGNYDAFSDKSDELLSAYNRRQAAMGETADFSAQLTALKAEKDQLAASLPAAKGTLRAEKSGYFVSKSDGYETVLTCENPESITLEYLNGIKAENVGENTVGKIVSDYEWYIAAEVSVNESLNFKEGDALTIYTSVKSYPKLPVTVKKINISESSGGAVVLFACNDMNSELASMRTGPMTVVKKEYSGLKVPTSARRVVDSKLGVYVLTGMQVKFVEVKVLFTDGDYMICEKQTSDGNVLRLYDEVIVKGKNLYDGKIIS